MQTRVQSHNKSSIHENKDIYFFTKNCTSPITKKTKKMTSFETEVCEESESSTSSTLSEYHYEGCDWEYFESLSLYDPNGHFLTPNEAEEYKYEFNPWLVKFQRNKNNCHQ